LPVSITSLAGGQIPHDTPDPGCQGRERHRGGCRQERRIRLRDRNRQPVHQVIHHSPGLPPVRT